MPPPRIDRVSSDDLMSLATDHGQAPMQVGAVLVLDTRDGLDVGAFARTLEERLARIPRFRRRLRPLPFWQGRPVWVDDPDFRLDRHLNVQACPAPGGLEAVLEVAARRLTTRLPPDRPLWAATLIPDMAPGQAALILVFHHVLADGLGGLAILAALADGAPAPVPAPFPRPPPNVGELVRDAIGRARAAARKLPDLVLRLGHASRQLGPALRSPPARSSLNRPTGARRHLAVVRLDLPALKAVAHHSGASVNDVLLLLVTGALARLLAARGEHLGKLVVSVPFSARRETTAQALGNHSGVIPLAIPTGGDPQRRLSQIAALTRQAKASARGASTALLAPLFLLLARTRLFQRFVNRQRLIHTIVTNLRGPEQPLSLGRHAVAQLIPLSSTLGNVTVAFAALSYAGTLSLTVISDSEALPEYCRLPALLQEQLEALLAQDDARSNG